MSMILNTYDSDGVPYLLLDCTEDEIGAIIKLLQYDFRKEEDAAVLRKVLAKSSIKTTGMMARHMNQLNALLVLDTYSLEYTEDGSNPTSDYRQANIRFIPEGCEDSGDLVDVKLSPENTEKLDWFMSYDLPDFLENACIELDKVEFNTILIGKTHNGSYLNTRNNFTGNVSCDLYFEID